MPCKWPRIVQQQTSPQTWIVPNQSKWIERRIQHSIQNHWLPQLKQSSRTCCERIFATDLPFLRLDTCTTKLNIDALYSVVSFFLSLAQMYRNIRWRKYPVDFLWITNFRINLTNTLDDWNWIDSCLLDATLFYTWKLFDFHLPFSDFKWNFLESSLKQKVALNLPTAYFYETLPFVQCDERANVMNHTMNKTAMNNGHQAICRMWQMQICGGHIEIFTFWLLGQVCWVMVVRLTYKIASFNGWARVKNSISIELAYPIPQT